MFSRLYLHIPWCVSKCNYCAFFSRPIPTEADLEETVQLLQTEMELSAKQFTVSKPLDSIYFGGGTPSLLTPVQVGRLLSHSKSLWEHSADMEITLEANPGTVSSDKLAGYLDVGVNRLSLGVQSFDDYQLSVLGRQHRSQQAEQAVLWARDAGFDAVGIDLICGLPDQTLADWQQQLSRAVEADVDHISVYCLSIEPGTPFASIYGDKARCNCFPDDDLAALMLEKTDTFLRMVGYEHYELSNFARAGKRSRHNCGYWQRDGYLGLGPSAHSFLTGEEATRFCNPLDYGQWAGTIKSGSTAFMDKQQLSVLDARAETIFLGLRLADGLCLDGFEQAFGERLEHIWSEALQKLQQADLLQIRDRRLKLTSAGMLLSNQVFVEFI